MAATFRLYSRAGCHLCDEMLKELESLLCAVTDKVTVEIVDIDLDPEIQRQFSLRIPLLTEPASGKILCETRFDPQSVLDYLTATNAVFHDKPAQVDRPLDG